MCAVNSHDIMHPSGPENGSGVCGRLFPNTSSIDSLKSIIPTFNLVDNWLNCFEEF